MKRIGGDNGEIQLWLTLPLPLTGLSMFFTKLLMKILEMVCFTIPRLYPFVIKDWSTQLRAKPLRGRQLTMRDHLVDLSR